MSAKIAVSGIGLVSPFGLSRETLAQNLSNGRTSREYVTKVDTEAFRADTGAVVHVDPSEHLEIDGLRQLDRASKLGAVATSLALEDAELQGEDNDRAVCLGSTYACLGAQGEFDRATLVDGPDWVNPGNFPYTSFNAQAAQIAIRFGARGANLTFTSGPTAGLDAVAAGASLIRRGDAETVLAGGVGVLNLDLLVVLEKCGLLGADGAGSIRALYHEESTGIVPGEGACVLVLESADAPRRREVDRYGTIHGEADVSLIDPEVSGAAAVEMSARRSLENGSHSIEDIDWICGGANGHPATDRAEEAGLGEVFPGDEAPLLTSMKASLGEQMGASGAFQVAGALLSLERDVVPAMPPGERDRDVSLPLVCGPKRLEAECVLCTSLSFSGSSTSVVVEVDDERGEEAAD